MVGFERIRSANASTAAITASPSRRGSTPARTTESRSGQTTATDPRTRPTSSGCGSGGGCSIRTTRATNWATAAGDSCPHHGDNSAITPAICSASRWSACRARACTCSLVITPAAQTPPRPDASSANAPARANLRAHPADHPRASSIAPSPTSGRLPDRAAAAIRRASSYSTPATVGAQHLHVRGRAFPSREPHRGQFPARHRSHRDHVVRDVRGRHPHRGRRPHISRHRRSTCPPCPHPCPHLPGSNTCSNPTGCGRHRECDVSGHR